MKQLFVVGEEKTQSFYWTKTLYFTWKSVQKNRFN